MSEIVVLLRNNVTFVSRNRRTWHIAVIHGDRPEYLCGSFAGPVKSKVWSMARTKPVRKVCGHCLKKLHRFDGVVRGEASE